MPRPTLNWVWKVLQTWVAVCERDGLKCENERDVECEGSALWKISQFYFFFWSRIWMGNVLASTLVWRLWMIKDWDDGKCKRILRIAKAPWLVTANRKRAAFTSTSTNPKSERKSAFEAKGGKRIRIKRTRSIIFHFSYFFFVIVACPRRCYNFILF